MTQPGTAPKGARQKRRTRLIVCSPRMRSLADKVKRFEHAANELRASHLSALDTISNGIAREDAMRAEIGRLGEKLCAAAKTIADLNERIVSANLSERAKRTGVPA
jgi:hypothetical protein